MLQVPLGPLEHRRTATELVRGILERGDGVEPSDRTIAELVDRGGGNPLFLVELAALAATCGAGSELPGSLRALIAARIDQLPSPQRAIIDNAAVLGSSDSIGSLARFAEAIGQDFHPSDLDELAADGLLDVDGRWWRFRSAVVREVAYQTLTKRVRAQRHAGVAAVMAERGAPIDDVAHHAATAAELLAELGPVDGVAAERSPATPSPRCSRRRRRPSTPGATRRRSATPAGPSTCTRPTRRRSAACCSCGRRPSSSGATFAEATADAEEVLAGAIADGDRIQEAEARRRLGSVAQMQGDLPTARRELDDGDRAVPCARRPPPARRRAAGPGLRRGVRRLARRRPDVPRRGDGDLPRDRRRARATPGRTRTWRGSSFQSGDFDDAEVQLLEAKERFEELGDANGVSWAEGLRAYVLYFQRRFDEAEQLAVAVEGEARRRAD